MTDTDSVVSSAGPALAHDRTKSIVYAVAHHGFSILQCATLLFPDVPSAATRPYQREKNHTGDQKYWRGHANHYSERKPEQPYGNRRYDHDRQDDPIFQLHCSPPFPDKALRSRQTVHPHFPHISSDFAFSDSRIRTAEHCLDSTRSIRIAPTSRSLPGSRSYRQHQSSSMPAASRAHSSEIPL